ncbi:MAG: MFS transporter [Oscillospiraceae bacterium]|nr:MFS transporter [Oscillospiraceae bacterium]
MDKMRRLKYACYTTGAAMAIVANLPPVLFLTFRGMYGLSYTQLGLLVLINFVTQLGIDLLLSFFSHKIAISKAVKLTPVLSVIGLMLYALLPMALPEYAYAGLVLGTVVFSASSGFSEVLISPVVAAIPAKDPDRQMSKLHSCYAWGTVGVVIISTGFLALFGSENWMYLALLFLVIPVLAAILYLGVKIPDMEKPEKVSGALRLLKNKGLWFCIVAIFLSGSAECTMSQWSSGYLEQALGIPKVWGDVFGVALFAVMLGLGRTLYGKFGKNVKKILFLSAVGAVLCYLAAALAPLPLIGLAACALTGFCTAMLWPGSLVVASEEFPAGGVFVYAIMAAGGDLGASIGPQMVGVVTDSAIALPAAAALAEKWGMTTDQLGMKLGMLGGMLFPLIAVFLYYRLWKKK